MEELKKRLRELIFRKSGYGMEEESKLFEQAEIIKRNELHVCNHIKSLKTRMMCASFYTSGLAKPKIFKDLDPGCLFLFRFLGKQKMKKDFEVKFNVTMLRIIRCKCLTH
jgi:hypothetical protein